MSFLTYAQNFEDVLLWRGLRDVKGGQYLDIGAQDPVVDSVSLSFYEAGWRGIHVEPIPHYAARLREARPDETVIEAAVTDEPGPIEFFEFPNTGLSTGRADIAERHSKADFSSRKIVVPSVRLDRLFRMFKGELHWLKIDVEGMEAEVLRSWGTSKRRPWLLVIESTLPNSMEHTEHLWLRELESRGYSDVYFDGLSRYFVHEKHPELKNHFGAPANVFDGFEVSRYHFATRALRAEVEGAAQRLVDAQSQIAEAQAGFQLAEQRLAVEQSRLVEAQARLEDAELRAEQEKTLASELRIQLDLAEGRILDEQSRSAGKQTRLQDAISDLRSQLKLAEQRTAAELALGASLQAKLAAVEEDRDAARTEHRVSVQELARAEMEHRASIEVLWKERQAAEQDLRRRSGDLEAQLRHALQEALAAHTAAEIELARYQEREAKSQEQIVAVEHQLQLLKTDLAQIVILIRQASTERTGLWASLVRWLGLSQPHASWAALKCWSPSINLPEGSLPISASYQAENVMQLPAPDDGRNPYLRASSLTELLSWNDIYFVRCAYVTVLGRQPDFAGESYYTHLIREGASKLQILWQLRNSHEGESHDPGIAGFDHALRQYRRARLPIVGPLLGRRYADEWSPAERRTRRLENNLWRAHEAQSFRLTEIEKIVRGRDSNGALSQSGEGGVQVTQQEILIPDKDPLGISGYVRNGSDDQKSEDLLSRFSYAVLANIRSKLSES